MSKSTPISNLQNSNNKDLQNDIFMRIQRMENSEGKQQPSQEMFKQMNEQLNKQASNQINERNSNSQPQLIHNQIHLPPNNDKSQNLEQQTPQTHGEHYKYEGHYLELFDLMKKFLPAYRVEVPKLFKLLVFNYLFSNGDAHLKNFAVLETPLGDHRLSPAYDLLNTRIHVEDSDFALEDGLLPKHLAQTTTANQFKIRSYYMIIFVF